MRRLLLPLAVAALLALGGLTVVQLLQPAPGLTQAEQAQRLAAELRCPDCQALSVAQSQTAAAAAIRRQIVDLLAAGETPDQVRAYFVDRFGQWILLAPSAAFAWWLPLLALLAGVGLLAWWLARGRGDPAPLSSRAPTDDASRARVRDELEQLDA